MRQFVLFISCSLLAIAQDWRFAHPDATLVGGIRPQVLLSSPLLAAEIADAMRKDPTTSAMIGMAQGFLSEITEVRFSILDDGSPEPDVIALVSGHMDESFLQTMSRNKGKRRVKRIDEDMFLLGDGASFTKALARMSKATRSRPRAVPEASLMDNDLWLSGRVPASAMTTLMAATGMKVQGIAMGIRMRDHVKAEMHVETATTEMAQKLIALATQMEAKQSTESRGQMHSSISGTTAHIVIDVPQQLMTDAARDGFAAGSAIATTQDAPVELPKRRTIVIQGLDDGPREIPLK